MDHKPWLLILTITLATALLGCVSQPGDPLPTQKTTKPWLTIEDDLGREIIIENPPNRIVSTAPSNTEIVFAVGAGDKLVGRTDQCDQPEEAKKVDSIGPYWGPSIETIVAKQPDVVLTTGEETTRKNLIEPLASRGITVVALSPATIDDVLRDIEMVAKIVGTTETAKRVLQQIETKRAEVRGRVSTLREEERKSVLLIWWFGNEIWTSNGVFANNIVEEAGGKNVNLGFTGYSMISKEALLKVDPDVILYPDDMLGGKSFYNLLSSDDALKHLSAVKNHTKKCPTIIPIDANLLSRPGPRVAIALEEVSRGLYPELYGKSCPVAKKIEKN